MALEVGCPTSKAMEKRPGGWGTPPPKLWKSALGTSLLDGVDVSTMMDWIFRYSESILVFLSLSYFIYLKINKHPGRLLDHLRYSSIFCSVLYRFVVSVV